MGTSYRFWCLQDALDPRVSRSAGWFRVITCHVLMRLAHGSSTLYFTDFSTSV
jgi:hypothetical protein